MPSEDLAQSPFSISQDYAQTDIHPHRGRGRPPQYATDEDRREAHRLAVHRHYRSQRAAARRREEDEREELITTMMRELAKHRRAKSSDEAGTPQWLLAAVLRALGRARPDRHRFDLDPCSPRRDGPTPARLHYTIHDDGLAQSWAGYYLIWINPPYSSPHWWVYLAALASLIRRQQLVMLTLDSQSTMWFKACVRDVATCIPLPDRVGFEDMTTHKSKGDNFRSALALLLYNCPPRMPSRLAAIDRRLAGTVARPSRHALRDPIPLEILRRRVAAGIATKAETAYYCDLTR